jgi:hypothetical protein
MRISTRFIVGLVALAGAILLRGTASATSQDSPSPRDKLSVWAGHWKRHGEVYETQFGHARTFDYDVQCSFLAYGAFMGCSSLSLQPDPNHGNRISKQITLYYYSDVEKTFKYTEVNEEGEPREGIALVDGNIWTKPITIQRQSGEAADGRFVYDLVSPDKHLARFEISTDKGAHWTVVDGFVDTKER